MSLPRINTILSVEYPTVTVQWNTGEVRIIDFKELLFNKINNAPHSQMRTLMLPAMFQQVNTDGRTLYWENLSTMLTEEGKPMPAPIDFCPDVLYRHSQLLSS